LVLPRIPIEPIDRFWYYLVPIDWYQYIDITDRSVYRYQYTNRLVIKITIGIRSVFETERVPIEPIGPDRIVFNKTIGNNIYRYEQILTNEEE
jgi:hypothetical protein